MSAEPTNAERPNAERTDAEHVIRVSAIVMRDGAGRVLNVRKRGTSMFILPGGKPEPGEAPNETALREFREEIGVELEPSHLTTLGVFRAAAANEPGHVVEAAVYEHPFVEAAGAAAPLAEIEALVWVDPSLHRDDMAPLNTEIIFPALLGGI